MNKLTKVLSVFVIAGAIGTGVAGVAGCKPKPSEDGGHTHAYEYTQITGNAEKHTVHCTNEGHDGADTQENHTWKDGKCEKCDYVKPTENPATKYSITYVINGHGTAPANVAEAEKLPATLPTLTEEGWTFGGWYTDAGFKTAAVAGATLTANTTLYAKWTQNQGETPVNKYSITYVINGHGTAPANVAEATALPETLPTLTEAGWTFGGWYTDAEFKTAATAGATLSANATLYAKWTQNQENPGDDFVIPATVTGLMIEGVEEATITLSAEKTSHTIDKSAITVYFATGDNADVKGDKVPADILVLELTDSKGAAVSSWEEIKKDGVYTVNASIKEDTPIADDALVSVEELLVTVNVTISNPVKADSLAVKTGTLTQAASVQDKMSADWTYTVTRANGDVEDYTGKVTVTVDTETAGEQVATLSSNSGALTGTVTVTITEAVVHTETYAVNLSGKEVGTLASEAPDAAAVELFKSANGNTKLEARGVNIQDNNNSAAQECDGKFFGKRGALAGATFTSQNALQSNQRYFILTTEGAAKLTIYWSRNNSADERGVSVFNSTVTSGDISALTPGATTVAKATLTTADQSVQKLVVNIPAAGTYWITSANNQNVYFYYIELTTEFEGEGTNVVLEDGESTLAQLKVSHDKVEDKAYVQQFVVGDTFSVDAGYSVKGTFITANTAKKSEQDLTDVTYWLGNTELKPDETVLTEDLFAKLGENTVTVKYGDSAVTGSYLIFVDSAVSGVTGITANVKNTVNPVLPSESAKLTLTKGDIVAAIVGENENAEVEITSVKYAVKGSDTQTEITAEGVELGAGEYVIYVVANVTDATASKSAEFDTSFALKVSVEGNGASWLYQDNVASNASDPDIAKDEEIDNNGSFTAKALVAAKSGANQNSAFNDNITNASNKPVAAADKTASGEAITFVNAVAFQTKAGDGTEYLEITAKKATTIYVYLTGSDDKHGSNRAGAKVYYSINGTTCDEADEVAVTNRGSVTVLKVELAAGDVLKVGVKKGTATDPRVWFYGIEAVDVVADDNA